uniref:Uncharacterized protein n=1 Tax=Morchella importuna TaxID=1174673 RepID=A0A650AFN1_9PEZI|nr:hypothetical protein [Morchella importuna]QGN66724.1 hypothetical protein [Morchella importuna]
MAIGKEGSWISKSLNVAAKRALFIRICKSRLSYPPQYFEARGPPKGPPLARGALRAPLAHFFSILASRTSALSIPTSISVLSSDIIASIRAILLVSSTIWGKYLSITLAETTLLYYYSLL